MSLTASGKSTGWLGWGCSRGRDRWRGRWSGVDDWWL